jgi:hypothetical protein
MPLQISSYSWQYWLLHNRMQKLGKEAPRMYEKMNLLGAMVAIAFFVSTILVFLFRILGRPQYGHLMGYFEFILTLPLISLLLDWIARHIDQADRAELWLPPYEHPETWLADMQVRIESQERAPMSRILD